jgi:hypothetical protein
VTIFIRRQITMRRCNKGMAQPNSRGFDAELSGYESSESPPKLVRCDALFQAGLFTCRLGAGYNTGNNWIMLLKRRMNEG